MRKSCLSLVFGLLSVLVVPSFVHAVESQRALNILFIGNHYTGRNDVMGMFKAIAESAGMPSPKVAGSFPAAVTLEEHLDNPETLELIKGGQERLSWDVVVLQEQTERACLAKTSSQVRSKVLQSGNKLLKEVLSNNRNATVVLYQIWAHRPDGWKKKPAAVVGLGANAQYMQFCIRRTYEDLAQTLPRHGAREVRIAPVGDMFEKNYASAHPFTLQELDFWNANLDGSYIAALVLYAKIYGARLDQVKFVPMGMQPERQQELKRFVSSELATIMAK